jgi:hypothetical protein
MLTKKAKTAIAAQERADDLAEDRAEARAEDRAEVARQKATAPAPPVKKEPKPKLYPKWVPMSELGNVIVNNEAQEAAVLNKTAKIEVTKTAQGDHYKVSLP